MPLQGPTHQIKKLKVARTARLPLHAIGDTQADEAIVLILACYGKGFSRCASMSEARIKMWRKKTDIGSALKLCSLPSTTEAFTENVKRAHLQAAHQKASIEGTMPPIDTLTHGCWEHDGCFLKPTSVPEGTLSATVAVLEMMRYGCASGCKGGHCKCSTIGCTVFCAYKGGEVCMNMLTKKSQESVPVYDDNDDELLLEFWQLNSYRTKRLHQVESYFVPL